MQNSIKRKRNLRLLSQLKHFVDISTRKLFYHAHISPHLTYASTVWDGCIEILFQKLNSVHRRAAKLMMPDLSLITDAKLQHLGLLPLREKLVFNKAELVLFKDATIWHPSISKTVLCVIVVASYCDPWHCPNPKETCLKPALLRRCILLDLYSNPCNIRQHTLQLQNADPQIIQK